MFKRIYIYLSIIILTLNVMNLSVKAEGGVPVPSADGAVLMNGITGDILYEKNADAAFPPASTTKILTTLITLEKCNLDDIVTVGEKPPYADGSSIALLLGEQASVRDLLYGLNLQSGNDCAEALAEHISGTQEKFAQLMNERARELGCTDSNFVNPSGLYDKNHKTSARDLAIILRELIKHPEYLKIASTLTYVMEPNNKSTEKRYIWNKNKLVQPGNQYYYKGALAGKTGYTTESEHSYVAAAERDGQIMIVTLIHDSTTDSYQEAARLLNYGFNTFQTKSLFSKNTMLESFTLEDGSTIPVLTADDFFYASRKDDNTVPTYSFNIDDTYLNRKSVSSGDRIGTAVVSKNGINIGFVDVLSGTDHKAKLKAAAALSLNVVSKSSAVAIGPYTFASITALAFVMLCLGLFKTRIKNQINRILAKTEESRN